MDECSLGTHNCHANSTCVDIDGSFLCTCDSERRGTSCQGEYKRQKVILCDREHSL